MVRTFRVQRRSCLTCRTTAPRLPCDVPASVLTGFTRDLAAMAVVGAAFFALEASLAPLLARRFPGYAGLEPRRRRQLPARAFESLACAYLCLGGLGGALAFSLAGLNYVNGRTAFAHAHVLA